MPRKLKILAGALLAAGLVVLWRAGTDRAPPPDPSAAATETETAPETDRRHPAAPEQTQATGGAEAKSAEAAQPLATGGKSRVMPPAELRPAVRVTLEADHYDDRLRAVIHDLPEALSAAEYQGLKDYLLAPQDGRDGDFRQHEYALRNYMMDAMREELDRLGETLGVFVSIYRNEAQGEVMRNYALQHLASIHIDQVSRLSAREKSRIAQTLRAALDDSDGASFPGTALVGLQDISRWDPEAVPPSVVAAAALKLLRGDAGALSRISAFQIAGELKLRRVARPARETAFDAEASRAARMSAVYALGQLGETGGLETLLNDSDKFVRKAALAALKRKR